MKEHPLLFSAPMVRAVQNGSKTQTRRLLKGSKEHKGPYNPAYLEQHRNSSGWASICPYGQPGDRLWVRETFWAYGHWEQRYSEKKGRKEWHFVDQTIAMDRIYQYSDPTPDNLRRHRRDSQPAWWKRPAIHMPRVASRIDLEITGVRVERLQECSESDAIAEGTPGGHGAIPGYPYNATAAEHYRWLWESINGAGSWDANPWVWVIEFKRAEKAA
jgi:hypothetical protein